MYKCKFTGAVMSKADWIEYLSNQDVWSPSTGEAQFNARVILGELIEWPNTDTM